MRLGFVGTGALSSAIVTGLKSLPGETTPVVVSPRNEAIAAELAARYADVRIAADNQAVLDQCDTVMLAVRPQIARELLKELRFRPDHHVISLIATISREEIAGLVAPAAQVGKALPMPMIARLQGATIMCPPDPIVAAFFGRLGDVIEVEDQGEFDALSVVTATYTSYFKYLDTIHAWVRGQGVPGDKARDYITSIYKALADAPDTAPDEDFMHLAQDARRHQRAGAAGADRARHVRSLCGEPGARASARRGQVVQSLRRREPQRRLPGAEPVQIKINDRRGVERQTLRDDEAADDCRAELQFRPERLSQHR